MSYQGHWDVFLYLIVLLFWHNFLATLNQLLVLPLALEEREGETKKQEMKVSE